MIRTSLFITKQHLATQILYYQHLRSADSHCFVPLPKTVSTPSTPPAPIDTLHACRLPGSILCHDNLCTEGFVARSSGWDGGSPASSPCSKGTTKTSAKWRFLTISAQRRTSCWRPKKADVDRVRSKQGKQSEHKTWVSLPAAIEWPCSHATGHCTAL